jgi:primosomal protein N'
VHLLYALLLGFDQQLAGMVVIITHEQEQPLNDLALQSADPTCFWLLLRLLLRLLQTVSESNREQLQPLIDLALQCAYNASLQGEARCRPTTMSIAIAAVATVQQYNMTADFVRLTEAVIASGSIPGSEQNIGSGDAADFEIAVDLDAAEADTSTTDMPVDTSSGDPAATSPAAADANATTSSSSSAAADGTVSTAAIGSPSKPAAAARRNSHSNAQRAGQQQQQPRRVRSPAAGSSSSRVAATAASCASCAPCDYKSFAPGEYPDSCPGYFVSDYL